MSYLTIQSTVPVRDGQNIPLLGFGVALSSDARISCLEAFKVGYRHIDSAQHYHNEAAVGEAIRESGIPRDQIFITSKVLPGTIGYEKTREGVDKSMQELGTDYVDLFLIHDPRAGPTERMPKYQALLDAKKAGKIRIVGVSNYGVKHLEEIRIAGLEMPFVNQIELHPFNQQKPIVEYCRKHHIVIEAFCPLVRGKMDDPVIVAVANKHQRDPAQVLIRWSLQKGFVPLPKSSTPARIASNAAVYDFILSEEDMTSLDSLDCGKEGSVSWNPVDHE